jgi:thiol:disulfide interchange protein
LPNSTKLASYRETQAINFEAMYGHKVTLRDQELAGALLLKNNELSALRKQLQIISTTDKDASQLDSSQKRKTLVQYDSLFENSLDFDMDFDSNEEDEHNDSDEDLFTSPQKVVPLRSKAQGPPKSKKIDAPKVQDKQIKERKQTGRKPPAKTNTDQQESKITRRGKKNKVTPPAQSQREQKKKAQPQKTSAQRAQGSKSYAVKSLGHDDLSIFDFTD